MKGDPSLPEKFAFPPILSRLLTWTKVDSYTVCAFCFSKRSEIFCCMSGSTWQHVMHQLTEPVR